MNSNLDYFLLVFLAQEQLLQRSLSDSAGPRGNNLESRSRSHPKGL